MAVLAPPKIKVRVAFGGQSIVIPVYIDTGAETFLFLDTSQASKLALPNLGSASVVGVGGEVRAGFHSKVDRIDLPDHPACTLDQVPILVGDLGLGLRGVYGLLGEKYVRQVFGNWRLDMDESATHIECRKGGQMVAVPSPMNEEMMIIVFGGVALVLGILLISHI